VVLLVKDVSFVMAVLYHKVRTNATVHEIDTWHNDETDFSKNPGFCPS
jgi:hypothetical protein